MYKNKKSLNLKIVKSNLVNITSNSGSQDIQRINFDVYHGFNLHFLKTICCLKFHYKICAHALLLKGTFW